LYIAFASYRNKNYCYASSK